MIYSFEKIFNRSQINFNVNNKIFKNKRILITGAKGSIGRVLHAILKKSGAKIYALDIEFDITKSKNIKKLKKLYFDYIFHLAADKRATVAEKYPHEISELNIISTRNIVKLKFQKLIFSSTCKAANPITSYGASKLICERIVLNARGTVVRFVNVFDSNFSVTRIWKSLLKKYKKIPVTNCKRYFMKLRESVDLMLKVAELEPHRYCVSNLKLYSMKNIAKKIYPKAKLENIPLRFGDRPVEQLVGTYEKKIKATRDISRIVDCWNV
jgi:FlaA1/EpsC-like NDP-sugar epimerase